MTKAKLTRWWTVPELARQWKTDNSTINKWIRNGMLRAVKVGHGEIRPRRMVNDVDRQAFEEAVRQNTISIRGAPRRAIRGEPENEVRTAPKSKATLASGEAKAKAGRDGLTLAFVLAVHAGAVTRELGVNRIKGHGGERCVALAYEAARTRKLAHALNKLDSLPGAATDFLDAYYRGSSIFRWDLRETSTGYQERFPFDKRNDERESR